MHVMRQHIALLPFLLAQHSGLNSDGSVGTCTSFLGEGAGVDAGGALDDLVEKNVR
jgi:hypothetical protein